MEKGKETFTEIKKLMTIVLTDGNKFYDENNKAAGTRARSALDAIATLKVKWRKEVLAS